jgi:hypothetical protein
MAPQMDEDNEAMSGRGALLPGHRFPAAAVLEAVLRRRGLWDERIEAELLSVGTLLWQDAQLRCKGHAFACASRACMCALRRMPAPCDGRPGPQRTPV